MLELLVNKIFSKMTTMKQILALFLAFFFTACSSQPSSIIPSTSPLPPGVRGTIPARGSDCQLHFLGIIPLSSSPDTSVALQEAKESADVDVLTDVTVDYGGTYLILFSSRCVRVTGLGVPRSRLSGGVTGHSLPSPYN